MPLNLAAVVVKARVVVPEPAAVYLILSETRHITGEDTYFLSGGYSTLLGLGMAPPPPPQISDSRIPRRHSQGLRGEEGGGEEEGEGRRGHKANYAVHFFLSFFLHLPIGGIAFLCHSDHGHATTTTTTSTALARNERSNGDGD